jgi:hypothetical protein
MQNRNERASIELIVLGLIAALILVLAIPYLTSIGQKTQKGLEAVDKALPTPSASVAP